nr:aminotransferase class V-fold PLP-dependent enzyme [Paenibacillus oceani]
MKVPKTSFLLGSSFRIEVQRMRIDMLAFPGYKGLLGPQGTGGLYLHPASWRYGKPNLTNERR